MLALFVAAAVGTPASADLTADGITSKIESNVPAVANTVFQGDAAGNIVVKVTIYKKTGALWTDVATDATLKVYARVSDSVTTATDTDPSDGDLSASVSGSFQVGWVERVSIPFTSQKGGQFVSFAKSDVSNPDGSGDASVIDIVVEFSDPAGSVSHHSEAKNRLIFLQRFDDADSLDQTQVPSYTA